MASRRICRSRLMTRKVFPVCGVIGVFILFSWTITYRDLKLCDETANRSHDPVSRDPDIRYLGSKAADKGGFYQVGDEDVYIYSAFYDARFRSKYIRMFGMQNRYVASTLRCRLRFSGGVKVDLPPETMYTIFEDWPSKKLLYHAYYYGCSVPDVFDFSKNFSFSVFMEGSRKETVIPLNMPQHNIKSEASMDDLFMLSSNKEKAQNSDTADVFVCVKAVWGHLNATRFIEWVEFNRLLGVSKIILYDTTVLGLTKRLLEYYQQSGFVEVVQFDYTLHMATIVHQDPMREQLANDDLLLEQSYLVSMNDCYYRYKDQSNYIMAIDLDEIIVPNEISTLPELLRQAEQEKMNVSAFLFQTSWHLEEFGPTHPEQPSYLHTQQYTKRSPVMQSQPKSIISSMGAIAINWHGAVTMPNYHNFKGNQYLPWRNYGFLHHYRAQCKYSKAKCEVISQMVEDDSVTPRYGSMLRDRVKKVMEYFDMS